jgi:hypothetical protein
MRPFSIALAAILVILPYSPVLSDTKSGDVEFSGSVSFMSVKSERFEEGDWYLNVAARTGVFLTPVFEIEPELMISKWKDADLGYILSCNLAVNMIPTGRRKPMAFLLGGIGFANTNLYLPNIPYAHYNGNNPDMIINIGGGLKVFAMDKVALRIEYRYQRFLDGFSSQYSEPGPDNISYHLFLVGFSLFRK